MEEAENSENRDGCNSPPLANPVCSTSASGAAGTPFLQMVDLAKSIQEIDSSIPSSSSYSFRSNCSSGQQAKKRKYPGRGSSSSDCGGCPAWMSRSFTGGSSPSATLTPLPHRDYSSPTPTKQPVHEDLTRSVSFKVDEVDGCRAFAPFDLDVRELLGRGFFGEVFKVCHKVTGELMVLKRLYRIDPKHERTFLKEAAVMRQLDHQNVLKFLGILYKDKQLHLITEFVSGGSLKRVLEDFTVPLSWCRRTKIAKDVAAGMNYLHSMNIIHRDLNSGNVLIKEEDGSAVVSDFGLARLVSRRKASRRRRYTVVGNPYWMAPEMLRECNYDERVDIFSFGITVCEIIGRCTADPDVLPRTADFGLHQEKFVGEFCADCPQPLFHIAFRCASIDPDYRPPFAVVYDWLEILATELELEEMESFAPSSPSIEALTRQILIYESSTSASLTTTTSVPVDITALRATVRCKKIPSVHRRKVSLDLGYEEPDAVSDAGLHPPCRCVSADPCCSGGKIEVAGGFSQKRDHL